MGGIQGTACCSDITSQQHISIARGDVKRPPSEIIRVEGSFKDDAPPELTERNIISRNHDKNPALHQTEQSDKKGKTDQRVRSSHSLGETKRSLLFGTGVLGGGNIGDTSNINTGAQQSFALVKKRSTAGGIDTTAIISGNNSGIRTQAPSLPPGWCVPKSAMNLPLELPPLIKAMMDFRPPFIPIGLDLTTLCLRYIKKSVFFGEWKGSAHCTDCFGFLLSGDEQLLSVGVFDNQSRASGPASSMYFGDGSFYLGGVKDGGLDGWGEFSDPPPSHLIEKNQKGNGFTVQASPRPADLLSVKPKLKGPSAGKLPYGGYIGQWQDNEHHGWGEEYKLEEFYYVGGFSRNLREGQGKLELISGEVYVGIFFGGQFHGQGAYKWPDGKAYQGAWNQGSMHGKGQMVWPNKRVYTGDFAHDQRNGFGVMEWSSGAKYEGFWKQDKKHGQGTARKADGSMIKGTWEFGSFKDGNYAAARDPNDGSVIGAGDSVLFKMGKTVSYLRSSEFDEEV